MSDIFGKITEHILLENGNLGEWSYNIIGSFFMYEENNMIEESHDAK